MAIRSRHKHFEVGQKAFIEREGEVLVLFTGDVFDFPGGRINDDETDLVASLKREVREETSLEVEVGVPFATWLGRGDTVFLAGYRCRYVSGDVVLSEEHTGYRWVNRATFAALDDGSAPFAALRSYFGAG